MQLNCSNQVTTLPPILAPLFKGLNNVISSRWGGSSSFSGKGLFGGSGEGDKSSSGEGDKSSLSAGVGLLSALWSAIALLIESVPACLPYSV